MPRRSSRFVITSDEEVSSIEAVFDNAMACLAEEDQTLPQIRLIKPLLLKGIGLHHSGLLPLIRCSCTKRSPPPAHKVHRS